MISSLADSYLAHIAIAVAARDPGAPYRTFFDNWYALSQGGPHLTTGGRPIWLNNPCALTKAPILNRLSFTSSAARGVIERATIDLRYKEVRKQKESTYRLMVDHAVPVAELRKMLWAIQPVPDQETISLFMAQWYRLGVITPEEDARLRAEGLVNSMPTHWNKIDPFARYKAARIE